MGGLDETGISGIVVACHHIELCVGAYRNALLVGIHTAVDDKAVLISFNRAFVESKLEFGCKVLYVDPALAVVLGLDNVNASAGIGAEFREGHCQHIYHTVNDNVVERVAVNNALIVGQNHIFVYCYVLYVLVGAVHSQHLPGLTAVGGAELLDSVTLLVIVLRYTLNVNVDDQITVGHLQDLGVLSRLTLGSVDSGLAEHRLGLGIIYDNIKLCFNVHVGGGSLVCNDDLLVAELQNRGECHIVIGKSVTQDLLDHIRGNVLSELGVC